MTEGDRLNGVPLGEVLLGFRNTYGELPPVPGVERPEPDAVPPPRADLAKQLGLHATALDASPDALHLRLLGGKVTAAFPFGEGPPDGPPMDPK